MALTETIKIRKGLKANLAAATFAEGELAFTTDSLEVYVSDASNTKYLTGSVKVGLFSARPSASTPGRVYVATDTSKVYFDTGSVWLQALIVTSVTLDDIADGTTYKRVVAGYIDGSNKISKLRNATASVDTTINDSGTSTSDLWTASRIKQEVSNNSNGLEYQNSVISRINYIKSTTGAPTTTGATTGEKLINTFDGKLYTSTSGDTWNAGVSESANDRYLFSITGTGTGAGITATKTNLIYEWTGSATLARGDGTSGNGTLATGWTTNVDGEQVEYVYNSGTTTWVDRPSSTNHNSLANLQGGTTNEYYHITLNQSGAIAGTSGTPSGANKFVTDADARNTNSRTPSGSTGGDLSGTYPTSINVIKWNGTAIDLTTSPTDGQIPMYSNASSKWIWTSTIDGGTF